MITAEDELRELREALRAWYGAQTYKESCRAWTRIINLMREGQYGQPKTSKKAA